MRPANSGWVPSMPESITATLDRRQAAAASASTSRRGPASRYHCCAASGSVLSNAARRAAGTHERGDRDARPRRGVSLDEQRRGEPGARPVARARNGRGRCPRAARPAKLQAPAASVAVEATVVQAGPACCWSCTAARRRPTGRDRPADRAGPSVASTRGATAIFASPARTSPQASRYCVATCGRHDRRERAVGPS